MPFVHHHTDLITTIDALLSPAECAALIAHAERLGFDDAPITTRSGPVLDKGIRDNRRAMADDPARAAWLWDRVAPFAPPSLDERRAIGLNERLRYYRYDAGHYFAPHFDGAFRRDNGEHSFWTFMVYLNDDFEGGETRFFGGRGEVVCTIVPRAGDALMFYHSQRHEGATVRSGRKYALRSDVMFEARR